MNFYLLRRKLILPYNDCHNVPEREVQDAAEAVAVPAVKTEKSKPRRLQHQKVPLLWLFLFSWGGYERICRHCCIG